MSGPSHVLAVIPEKAKFIEYYACMHPDLQEFFPNSPHPRSALRTLADQADSLDAHIKAAQFSADLIKRFPNRTIIGFATFLPEIMLPDELCSRSTSALRFLVMTAHEILSENDKSENAPPRFVLELVGGSRTQGLFYRNRKVPTKNPKIPSMEVPEYHVGLLRASELQSSIRELVNRLKPVAQEAIKRGRGRILLGLQLEPGPFFLVNSAHALDLLCQELDSDSSEPWKRIIGLNLDVGHWAFLTKHHPPQNAQLTPDWLEQNPHVMNRIVHAHICDQSIGHLGDLHICARHSESEFTPWMELIERRASQKANLGQHILPFSGFIGIEHEACKSPKQVAHSFETLAKWLSDSARQAKAKP